MRDLRMAATGLEFKNVVFNAARDGKLRRLKVQMHRWFDQRLSFPCNLGEDDLDDLNS